MHWVWGYSLGQGRPVLVPEQLVYYLDWRAEYGNFVQECSNGCASGSCLEEAVLYGLLELVERDAFLLQWYGRGRPPEIDLSTCTDAETRAMAERLDLLGYDTHLFDIRVDLPIPAVMAVARRREPAELGNLCFSASTGLDPERAVAAALRETASYVLDMTTLSARIAPQLREMVHDYTKVTDLAHHSMLYGLPEMSQHAAFLFEGDPPRPLDGLYKDWSTGYPATGDLTDDLHRCLDLVRGLGFDVIVVDQTSPEQAAVGISTACVLVPGLLPIDFGWLRQRAPAMPRMRTAFRAAGLRDHDLEQGDLHLHPHPFP
jgi:ribosomal protein S12 methylthiotransferase accessory factor